MHAWLDNLVAHPLRLGTDADGLGNMAYLSRADARGACVDEIVQLVESAASIRRRQVPRGVAGEVTFYAWHDVQALQLRCSVVLGGCAALPFGAEPKIVPDLQVIVRPFMDGDELIRWADLEDVALADVDWESANDVEPRSVTVWVEQINP